jgi:hypothetical protein
MTTFTGAVRVLSLVPQIQRCPGDAALRKWWTKRERVGGEKGESYASSHHGTCRGNKGLAPVILNLRIGGGWSCSRPGRFTHWHRMPVHIELKAE